MGACSFINIVRRKYAKDAEDAFRKEVERSQYESGRLYSGEIGMKHGFVRARGAKTVTTLDEAYREAERLINHEELDKWGPAWMIEVEGPEGGWVFFGLAAS
jgi:hypothetical protein